MGRHSTVMAGADVKPDAELEFRIWLGAKFDRAGPVGSYTLTVGLDC